MINIKTIEDIYPAISELIALLGRNEKGQQIATILQHRMYKVSWTTQSELFEEISKILNSFIKTEKHSIDAPVLNQINKILRVIEQNK